MKTKQDFLNALDNDTFCGALLDTLLRHGVDFEQILRHPGMLTDEHVDIPGFEAPQARHDFAVKHAYHIQLAINQLHYEQRACLFIAEDPEEYSEYLFDFAVTYLHDALLIYTA